MRVRLGRMGQPVLLTAPEQKGIEMIDTPNKDLENLTTALNHFQSTYPSSPLWYHEIDVLVRMIGGYILSQNGMSLSNPPTKERIEE